MKNLVVFLLLMLSVSAISQQGNQSTDSFFSFPDNNTLGTNNLVKVQYSTFLDAFGKPPSGESGRQFGVELTAIMGMRNTAWLFVAPSISTFPQLEDGYTDTVVTIGTNWHMFHTTAVRYYSGLRLGMVWRGDGGYPLTGITSGLDVRLITLKDGSSIHLGGELFVDSRTDQDIYGDESVDKGVIFTGNRSVENGKFKLSFRF